MQENSAHRHRHIISRGTSNQVPLNQNLKKFPLFKTLRGVRKKSGPGVKSSNFSANIGPTETYYIPNQWKLNKAFAELCRFEIAALIE